MVINSKLKIPKSRIGVLIGSNGETKKEIESLTRVSIEVNSNDGSIHILETPETPDPTFIWKARDIIRAIGKGFSAEKAFNLIDDDIYLETIDLEGSKNNIHRIKSRIIGEKGKARRMIEANTDAYVSVFGNQVSLIGELSEIKHAKEAVLQLIQGSKHATVYRYLEQLRFQSRQEPLKIWKDQSFEED